MLHAFPQSCKTMCSMGGSRGRVQRVRAPLPAESALFCRRVLFSNQNFPQKRHSFIAQKPNFPQKIRSLVHCTKPKFFPRKKPSCFFATRKDMESYIQMPGKRILALEFSNFSGEGPPKVLRAFGARRVCPFSEVAPPVPEILDPPLCSMVCLPQHFRSVRLKGIG
jgi:hypothetical protein